MKSLRSKKGMTLVEMIVAMSIFAIISVPMLTTVSLMFKVMAKKKVSIEDNAVIRIVKENVVDAIKDGSAKSIASYKDRNADAVIDDNDNVYWKAGNPGSWNMPEDAKINRVENLKVVDKDGKVYEMYKFNIEYESSYSDSKFPNVRKFKIEIFTRYPNNASQQGKNIKNFNVFVDTKY